MFEMIEPRDKDSGLGVSGVGVEGLAIGFGLKGSSLGLSVRALGQLDCGH